MKKILLAMALLGTVISTSQAQKLKVGKVQGVVQKTMPEMRKVTKARALTAQKEVKFSDARFKNAYAIPRKADATVELLYNIPNGAMFWGLTDESRSYAPIVMNTGAFVDVPFYNYSSKGSDPFVDVTWSFGEGDDYNQPLEQSVNEEGDLTAQGFYELIFPILSGAGSTYEVKATDDNDALVQSWWEFGTDSVMTNSSDVLLSLSNASPALGFYSGYGGDYRFASKKDFYYLDGLVGNNPNWVNTGKKVVGFAESYNKPYGTVYAESVTAWFWGDGVDETKPLDGKTLTAEIATLDEEGNFVNYAMAYATDADATHVGNGLYLINFRFIEHDDILGDVDAPITLPEEAFVVLLNGFDELSGSFTAPFADTHPDAGFGGHAYAILEDGSLNTIGYTNDASLPMENLHIGFHAAIPVAELDDPDVVAEIPAEGGYGVVGYQEVDGQQQPYNNIVVYSKSSLENWIIVEKPDWLEIEVDDSYFAEGYPYYAFYLKGEALPSGVDGRSGNVVLELFGKQVVIPVTQGNATAVEGVKVSGNAKMTDGLLFNVAGQQVNKNYKGIVIKDGRKFIQK